MPHRDKPGGGESRNDRDLHNVWIRLVLAVPRSVNVALSE